MRIAAEISFYPLSSKFKPPIRDFIARLKRVPGLEVQGNSMSTQVFCEYNVVLDSLKNEMRPHLQGRDRVVFATKFMGPV